MARPDKSEKQARRAREEVERALGRGRAGDAADALFKLAPGEREWALPAVSRAMATELSKAFDDRGQDVMLAWLRRTEKESRLVDEATDSYLETQWILLTAALRARQWPRARQIWSAISAGVRQTDLTTPLSMLLRTDAELDLSGFVELVSDDLARLGYDDGPRRAAYAAPTSTEQVSAACLACFCAEPWARFRDVVEGWVAQASEPVRREIVALALHLSHRELLLLRKDGKPEAMLEVASFCARHLAALGPVEEHAKTAEWCVRVLARAMEGKISARLVVEAGEPIVRTTLSYPALVPLVQAVLTSTDFEGAALDQAPRLFHAAIGHAPSPALVLKCAKLIVDAATARTHSDRPEAPDWLIAATERLLSAPAELARSLTARRESGADDIRGLLSIIPTRLATRIVDQTWSLVDEVTRAVLADCVAELVERMKESARVPSCTPADLSRAREFLMAQGLLFVSDIPDATLREMLDSPEAREFARAMGFHNAVGKPLAASHREDWLLLQSRVLPYNPTLLETALGLEHAPKGQLDLINLFWSRRPTLLSRIAAIRQCAQMDLPNALDLLDARLLSDGLVPSALDAAHTFLLIHRKAPDDVCALIASALFDAVERDATQADLPQVRQALVFARRRFKAKQRKPRAKKAPARAKRGNKAQVSLFGEEERSAP